jgi:hypothetical protein
MIKFPSFIYGVIIGLLLSDAWLQLQSKNRSINSHLGFKQSIGYADVCLICLFYFSPLLF